jgi:hypothetical protein|tara:strand:+ start:4489 stop:4659 length:171 start_codon:yes stop_codon:yes gene_type:complete
MIEYLLYAGILIICAQQAYTIGIREGAERTVTRLHKEKIIRFDNTGQIKPNPFFDA